MIEYDIVLLTESRYDRPSKVDDYIRNILTEDGLLTKALESEGLRVFRTDWARPDFDWGSTRMAIFRTTWDYFHRFAEFSKWLEMAALSTRLLNPPELIRWNMDKHYLLDLKENGVNIPPTVFFETGTTDSLERLHAGSGWKETVLKPAVSGAGRHTYRLDQANLSAHESIFRQLIAQESMMLQPFQHNVVSKGEVALMVFGGKFSHAILKLAKEGEFRVQDDFGGTVHPYSPSPEEVAFAEEVVALCDPQPLYARVDVIRDNEGELAVAELELIEPELWFRMHPPAARLLAAAIARQL
jgi:glutathione synthase/RimK-type ligase-like ATP-grasp enzyme